jgi:hypothetical protein
MTGYRRKAIERRSLLEKASSSGESGEGGVMFLGSKCLNEPSLCCSATATNPKRKNESCRDSMKEITTLAAVTTAVDRMAVRELCNKPQSASRFPIALIFCPVLHYT